MTHSRQKLAAPDLAGDPAGLQLSEIMGTLFGAEFPDYRNASITGPMQPDGNMRRSTRPGRFFRILTKRGFTGHNDSNKTREVIFMVKRRMADAG